MRITLVQTDLIWENKNDNLNHYQLLISELAGQTDLVVLPEMCTTGFTMNATMFAESSKGETIQFFSRLAKKTDTAIAGSFIGKDAENNCYNRGFFVQPDGTCDFYDKKHLFRMGDEPKHYESGKAKTIVQYMGWNIRLSICYDLRFPVWLRNVDNEYDLLLVVSNWPEGRQSVFDCLLKARALENQAYVCGVNRIGQDGTNLNYIGGSALINAYGKPLNEVCMGKASIQTVKLNLEDIQRFREKFPVWKDADRFELIS